MEQDKKNTSTGEWEFEIDIDSIRSQAQQEDSADSLIAELDRMARREIPDDLDLSAPEEPAPAFQETTRVIPAAGAAAPDGDFSGSDEDTAQTEDITTEQTVVIPAASSSARSSRTVPGNAGTHPVANTRSASSAARVSRTAPQPAGSPPKAPASKASLTPAQQRRMKHAQQKREKRLARVERSRQRPKFRLAPVLASLLAITNVVTLGGYGLSYIQTRLTVQEAEKTAQQSQEEAKALRGEMDELQKNSISVDTFTNLVAEYNLSAQFIQEFFDDRIVYKDTSVHYAPIDESLPMNSYDWSYLSWGDGGRPAYTPDGERHATLGVDVSYHQGEINWEAVAADGIQFAMIRCGYRGYGNGDLVTDSCYQGNMQRALDNGLDVGVYFFSQAITEEEAVEEAEYVLSLLEGYTVEMPVVFDMEILQEDARANNLISDERVKISKAFCDTIRAAGYTPMIYGNTAYYMSKLDFASLAGEYGIWLAQYYDEPFFPYQFNMWQYTNNGTVDGIAGTVDLNLYFGE